MMNSEAVNCDLLQKSVAYIQSKSKLIGDPLLVHLDNQNDKYLSFAEGWLSRLLAFYDNSEQEFHRALDGYVRFCFDHIQSQSYLMRHGRYKMSGFEEANRLVYSNKEVMEGFYLDGIYLSLIFWPNHYAMYDFFVREIASQANVFKAACEIGVGHGAFLGTLLSCDPYIHTTAIDISNYSLKYARKMIALMAPQAIMPRFMQCDIREGLPDIPSETFDIVIMGELIEHVESPDRVLSETRRVLGENGKLMMSTAINAGETDHIFLFESIHEVRDMISSVGLTVECELVLPLRDGMDEEELMKNRIPINYACILTK